MQQLVINVSEVVFVEDDCVFFVVVVCIVVGLCVYVDFVMGEFILMFFLWVVSFCFIEFQVKLFIGDVEREIVEILGIGIGVYVGDFFLYLM